MLCVTSSSSIVLCDVKSSVLSLARVMLPLCAQILRNYLLRYTNPLRAINSLFKVLRLGSNIGRNGLIAATSASLGKLTYYTAHRLSLSSLKTL